MIIPEKHNKVRLTKEEFKKKREWERKWLIRCFQYEKLGRESM